MNINLNKHEKELFTGEKFEKLIKNSFDKNLDYIFALVIDIKSERSLYDGCQFANIKLTTNGQYNPNTAERIDQIYYYYLRKDNPNSPTYLCSQNDLENNRHPSMTAYLFAQDPSLDSLQRAEYQFQMGQCFYSGIGVEQNSANAFDCYKKAGIEGKHPQALYMIGFCLENGEGIEKNKTEAMQYYLEASKYSTDVELLVNIAQKFEKRKEMLNSQSLYEKAAQSKDLIAIDHLNKFYERIGKQIVQKPQNQSNPLLISLTEGSGANEF